MAALRRVSAERSRAGHRVAAAHLRREGWTLNDKRAQRLWREEGLKVPRRQRKLRRLGSSANSAQRLRATRVNEVWSYDFVFDQTEDGQRLKWLPICDEFSRESVALEVERRMEIADVIRILDAAVAERGTAPDFIRSDNGPEFIAADVQAWILERGFKTLYIAPSSLSDLKTDEQAEDAAGGKTSAVDHAKGRFSPSNRRCLPFHPSDGAPPWIAYAAARFAPMWKRRLRL